jgi:hypothetical protein
LERDAKHPVRRGRVVHDVGRRDAVLHAGRRDFFAEQDGDEAADRRAGLFVRVTLEHIRLRLLDDAHNRRRRFDNACGLRGW